MESEKPSDEVKKKSSQISQKKHLVWSEVNYDVWMEPHEGISISHLAANANVSLRLLTRGGGSGSSRVCGCSDSHLTVHTAHSKCATRQKQPAAVYRIYPTSANHDARGADLHKALSQTQSVTFQRWKEPRVEVGLQLWRDFRVQLNGIVRITTVTPPTTGLVAADAPIDTNRR